MRNGVLRLFMLRLPQQVAMLRACIRQRARDLLPYRALGSLNELAEDVAAVAFARVFLPPVAPHSAEVFAQRLAARRAEAVAAGEALCFQTAEIIQIWHRVRLQLGGLPAAVRTDIECQLEHLITARFLRETPADWLDHLPRFLRGIEARLGRLAAGPARDAAALGEIAPHWERVRAHLEACAGEWREDEAFVRYRWMVEELRVSLFAQSLGTSMPVSTRRLEAQWHKVCEARISA